MTWRVRHTRTFYKELARLPAEVRRWVEEVAFGEAIKEDPFWHGPTQNDPLRWKSGLTGWWQANGGC